MLAEARVWAQLTPVLLEILRYLGFSCLLLQREQGEAVTEQRVCGWILVQGRLEGKLWEADGKMCVGGGASSYPTELWWCRTRWNSLNVVVRSSLQRAEEPEEKKSSVVVTNCSHVTVLQKISLTYLNTPEFPLIVTFLTVYSILISTLIL